MEELNRVYVSQVNGVNRIQFPSVEQLGHPLTETCEERANSKCLRESPL